MYTAVKFSTNRIVPRKTHTTFVTPGAETRHGYKHVNSKRKMKVTRKSSQVKHETANNDVPPFVSVALCLRVCVASARRGLRLARKNYVTLQPYAAMSPDPMSMSVKH